MAILWTSKVAPIWKSIMCDSTFSFTIPPSGNKCDVRGSGHHFLARGGDGKRKKWTTHYWFSKLVQLSTSIKWPFLNEIPSIFFFKINIFLWRIRFWPRNSFILKWTPENWLDKVLNFNGQEMANCQWIFELLLFTTKHFPRTPQKLHAAEFSVKVDPRQPWAT